MVLHENAHQVFCSFDQISLASFRPSDTKDAIEIRFKAYARFAFKALESVLVHLDVRTVDGARIPVDGRLVALRQRGFWYAFSFKPLDASMAAHIRFVGLNHWSNINKIVLSHGGGQHEIENLFFKAEAPSP